MIQTGDGDRKRQLSYQQEQQYNSKVTHERQMMELRAIHERKVSMEQNNW